MIVSPDTLVQTSVRCRQCGAHRTVAYLWGEHKTKFPCQCHVCGSVAGHPCRDIIVVAKMKEEE